MQTLNLDKTEKFMIMFSIGKVFCIMIDVIPWEFADLNRSKYLIAQTTLSLETILFAAEVVLSTISLIPNNGVIKSPVQASFLAWTGPRALGSLDAFHDHWNAQFCLLSQRIKTK